MKFFHLLGFTKELLFGSSTSVTELNLFLEASHFLKEPAGIVCHAFEVFSRGYILIALKIIIVFFL